jgi:endonuclease G
VAAAWRVTPCPSHQQQLGRTIRDDGSTPYEVDPMNLKSILSDTDLRDELLEALGPRRPGQRPWGIVGASLSSRALRDSLLAAVESPDTLLVAGDEREAIIRLFLRPVLTIRSNSFDPDTIEEPESRVWRERLLAARPLLERAIPGVGRIEVRNHPRFDWLATGWLVAKDTAVTNRHVIDEIAYRDDDGSFRFHEAPNGERIRAALNFRAEQGIDEESEHRIDAVLQSAARQEPDVAFVRLRHTSSLGDPLPIHIPPAPESPQAGQRVAVIGYPAEDGRRNDPIVMERLFRGIYGFKRLAPGQVLSVRGPFFTHDCTTLGGNSGSVIVDLATGKALGVHYAGRYGRENYAVSISWIDEELRKMGLVD